MVAASPSQTTQAFHNFLTAKLKLTPLRAFIALLIIGLVDELLIGFLTGHWNSTSDVLGAVEDYPHWIVSFIFQPAVWAYFLWLLPATEKMFSRIEAEAIPEKYVEAYRTSQVDFFKSINAPWISWLSLAVGVLLVVLSHFFTSSYHPVPWTYHLEWHRYSIWSLRLLAAGFCFSFSIFYSILVIINLNKVFGLYGVRLHLYHGDNVAGLKFIGDFALSLNQLALISISFLISDSILALEVGHGIKGQINLILEFIAFPTILLFSFVAPLIACRRAMREAKIAELNQKASQINAGLQRVEHTPNATKDQIEDLTALINLRQRLASDIPTLPIDITALRTFSLTFTVSLLPALISIVIQIITFFNKK
jgi:hypothetical protein